MRPRDRVPGLLARIRFLVHVSSLTQRSIEERCGFSRGYLSQILRGHIDLKIRHLLAILGAIGFAPDEFFAELFGVRRFALGSLASSEERTGGLDRHTRLQLIRLFSLGLDSLEDFHIRLERCEAALARVSHQFRREAP